MTKEEINAKLGKLHRRRFDVGTRMIMEARALVPVLLDAGRVNSAKVIQELLFELDVIEQESTAIVEANPEAAIEAMLDSISQMKR